MIIAIKGCEAHRDRANAIKATWAKGSLDLVAFFTGKDLKVPDDRAGLCAKVRAICRLLKHEDYIFVCDTDTYVHIPRLVYSGSEKRDYAGYRLEDKTYASGGAGYWLSNKAIQVVAEAKIENFEFEDEMVGDVLAAEGIKLHHDPRFALYREVLPDNDIITRHLSSRGPFTLEMMYAAHKRAHEKV